MSRVRVNKVATKDASKQFNVSDVVDMLTNASNLKAASSSDSTNLKSLGDWFKQTNRAVYQNYIINGNFDIWQRATNFTFTTTASSAQANYTADRWLFQCQANNATISQQFTGVGTYELLNNMSDNFMRVALTNISSSNSYAVLNQRIEKPMRFLGKTVTISFMAKASDASLKVGVDVSQYTGKGGTFINGTGKSVTLTTSWARYSLSFTVPANTNNYTYASDYSGFLEIGLWMDAAGTTYSSRSGLSARQAGTFDFAQVQIEVGDVATPYRPKLPQEELFDCHRFYWKGLPSSAFNFSAYTSGAYMSWPIKFPRTMRATPTTTILVNGGTANADYSSSLNVSLIKFDSPTVEGARFLLQASAADPNVYINFPAGSYMAADAELMIT